ncbi:hypothetical protein CHS0354_011284 [Potamilus streckersoni]|uniref:Caspase-2 n=1 Tax=Potamilus streckersoni TaxID=2493646 RepID=A0AAE0S947_9BIVA|nr:hypothetical protein CHS0354_011284 [Potamilus streckersoni]
MDERHKEILKTNRTNLRKNIANPEDINDVLFSRGVFTESMKQEVEAEKTPIQKLQKIMDIVPKRGSEAFDIFYEVLVETGNGTAADFLKPELKAYRLQNPGQPFRRVGMSTNDQLPSEWPNEQAMTDEIKVLSCDRSSRVFRENWNSTMTYSMKKKIRGRAIIINNRYFHGPRENGVPVLSVRHGTEKDRDRLKILFQQLHFDVHVHEEKSAQEIKNVLAAEIGDSHHATAECFILAILSHGTSTGIYGVDGEVVSVEDITGFFSSDSFPNLAGKPKIFFIQACQGENLDRGGIVNNGPDITNIGEILKKTKELSLNEHDAVKDPVQSSENRIATTRDILIASATHPGFVSLRNILHGSWFIQAVIWVFQRYACEEELSSLLKMVNNIVSKGRTADPKFQTDIFQAARYSDSFIKKFYFFPGCHE